jgi:hypothetical protein
LKAIQEGSMVEKMPGPRKGGGNAVSEFYDANFAGGEKVVWKKLVEATLLAH